MKTFLKTQNSGKIQMTIINARILCLEISSGYLTLNHKNCGVGVHPALRSCTSSPALRSELRVEDQRRDVEGKPQGGRKEIHPDFVPRDSVRGKGLSPMRGLNWK